MPENHKINLRGVIDYSTFFNKPAPDNPYARLEKYPTHVIVIILAKLNAILFSNPNNGLISDTAVFEHCLTLLDSQWYRRVKKIRQLDGDDYHIFFTPQSVTY